MKRHVRKLASSRLCLKQAQTDRHCERMRTQLPLPLHGRPLQHPRDEARKQRTASRFFKMLRMMEPDALLKCSGRTPLFLALP